MSRFIEVDADKALQVEDAVRMLEGICRQDAGFLQSASKVLHGLYLNRGILEDTIRAELRNASKEKTVFYSPQSFLIALGRFSDGVPFTLRGNLWFPRSLDGENQLLEDYVYSYDNCHDHNFEFLTIGYAGPGYRTDLYEYSPEATVGYVGENVTLRALGEVQLEPGKILHFRKSVDVHVQKHPEALSVSLNLLIADPDVHHLAQYEFDPRGQKLVKTIYSSSMHYASFALLAGELEQGEAASAVFAKLKDSPMWQLRHASGRAMFLNELMSASSLDAMLNLPAGVSVADVHRY